MAVESLATRTLHEGMRLHSSQTRVRLSEAAEEVASGRHHDIGLALAERSSRLLDMRSVFEEIDSLSTSNEVLESRLSAADAALSAIADIAEGFLETLVAARSGVDRTLLASDAGARLKDLVGLLSTTSNNSFVFSGLRSDTAPLKSYIATPAGAAQTQIIDVFTAEFGFGPTAAQVTNITPGQLSSYLDGAFAAQFEHTAWSTTFSAATDEAGRQRISPNQVAEVPVSANDAGIRRLFAGLVAVIDTGGPGLSSDSFTALSDWAAQTVSSAVVEIAASRATIGMTQERLTKANATMMVHRTLLDASIGRLEGVDANEASSRLFALNTQLEMSYALTARLQRISLMNYL